MSLLHDIIFVSGAILMLCGGFLILGYVLSISGDYLWRRLTDLHILFTFVRYKKEFKEYLKNKKKNS